MRHRIVRDNEFSLFRALSLHASVRQLPKQTIINVLVYLLQLMYLKMELYYETSLFGPSYSKQILHIMSLRGSSMVQI